jgi:hypothetical protein
LLGNESVKRSRRNEYASNNQVTSVTMQRNCKYAFPTIERPFSAWSVQSGYKEEFNCEELVKFRDTSLPGYEPGSRRIELAVAE